MILTLAANSAALKLAKNGKAGRRLLDVPKIAIDQLELRGLNIYASSLAGWKVEDLDALRDAADKAACPCLVLIDEKPLNFWQTRKIPDSKERIARLCTAANRLGCNSIAVRCEGPDADEAFELTATTMREAMAPVERLELNILLIPNEGLTNEPDRLTDLIKRIGGFRIGSLPSFGHAVESGDTIETLRKLAPYAGAINATIGEFTKGGKHKPCDLADCVHAIRAVGFANTLAIEYVGDNDPAEAISTAREALAAALEADPD